MLSVRRLVLLLLLSAVPVAVASIIAATGEDIGHADNGFVDGLMDGTIIAAILPIVTMALATAAFGDEVEDRTLSYLVLKPVPRSHIVLPKLVASVVVAAPLIAVNGITATIIGLDGEARSVLAVAVALTASVIAYASIFTWAGLMTTRALGFALVLRYPVGGSRRQLPGRRSLSERPRLHHQHPPRNRQRQLRTSR